MRTWKSWYKNSRRRYSKNLLWNNRKFSNDN